MRFEKYINENYKKALSIGEPETGGKYSDDSVKRRIKEIEAGIKDANKLPDNEAKEGILADLEDKLDKWQNVDKETEAPKAAAPPEGDEEGEKEPEGEEEEVADTEAEEDDAAKEQENKEKEKEDKEIEKDEKAADRDEKREKEREKKEKEREKMREKSQKKESIMKFKEYLINEKFSKGDKVKVINKDDEYYGKKGIVHVVKKGAQTVKLDGIDKQNVVSFNDDELKKL